MRNILTENRPIQKEIRTNLEYLWHEAPQPDLEVERRCTTAIEIAELGSTEALLNFISWRMATYKRLKLKTIDEATGLADDFVINRGCTYEVATEIDQSTNKGK